MRVLVTGGAGYIGSHTCKELAQQGYDVIVYDNLSTGHKELVQWGDFEYGDILDTEKLFSVMHKYKPSGVIHFAAKSIVNESLIIPGDYFRNNVTGTLNILDAMFREGIDTIVVSGTCAVYGHPESIPINENSPTHPINPYGLSKLWMEHILQAYEEAHNIRWMSLRYFNAAGCDLDAEIGEKHDPETHLIPRALMAVAGDAQEISIFGDDYKTEDGTCIRDYIHVCDLAHAHMLALRYLMHGGQSEALNLGTGKGFSVKEIFKSIAHVIDKHVPYRQEKRREGDPACLISDAKKAKLLLGWEPKYSDIDTIISTAWVWYNQSKKKIQV